MDRIGRTLYTFDSTTRTPVENKADTIAITRTARALPVTVCSPKASVAEVVFAFDDRYLAQLDTNSLGVGIDRFPR